MLMAHLSVYDPRRHICPREGGPGCSPRWRIWVPGSRSGTLGARFVRCTQTCQFCYARPPLDVSWGIVSPAWLHGGRQLVCLAPRPAPPSVLRASLPGHCLPCADMGVCPDVAMALRVSAWRSKGWPTHMGELPQRRPSHASHFASYLPCSGEEGRREDGAGCFGRRRGAGRRAARVRAPAEPGAPRVVLVRATSAFSYLCPHLAVSADRTRLQRSHHGTTPPRPQLLSPEQAVISRATEVLEQMKKLSPNGCIQHLVRALRQSAHDEVRACPCASHWPRPARRLRAMCAPRLAAGEVDGSRPFAAHDRQGRDVSLDPPGRRHASDCEAGPHVRHPGRVARARMAQTRLALVCLACSPCGSTPNTQSRTDVHR